MNTKSAIITFAVLATAQSGIHCADEEGPPGKNIARDPLDLPAPIQRSSPKTVEVKLTAREVAGWIAEGKKAWVWTFNGKVPGPMIRVRKGDTVSLSLTNDSDNVEPHNIDLHAVVGPGGGGSVTEIEPGETAHLRFKAEHEGAFLYHCAAEGEPAEHVAHGMFGVILVEPEAGLPKVDREAYIVQNEWYLTAGSAGAGEEEEEEEEHGGGGGGNEPPTHVLMLDEEAAKAERPEIFAFNGHAEALSSPKFFGDAIRVRQGGRMRLIFGNAGPNLASSFHVIGGIMDRVYTGGFDTPVSAEETVLVPPGSAVVVEMDMPVPGTYSFVDHALYRPDRGAMGKLHVDARGAFPKDLYSPKPSGDSSH